MSNCDYTHPLKLVPLEVQEYLYGKAGNYEIPRKFNLKLNNEIVDETEWLDIPLIKLKGEPSDVESWFDYYSHRMWSPLKRSLNKLTRGGETIQGFVLPKQVLENTWLKLDGLGGYTALELEELPRTLVLDLETVYVQAQGIRFVITAVAYDGYDWYLYKPGFKPFPSKKDALIPFPDNRLVIGHNVSYERSYLDIEYNFDSHNEFMCTLSMAMSIYGLSDQQTALYKTMKNRAIIPPKFDWVRHASEMGLDALYKKIFRRELKKDVRNDIVKIAWEDYPAKWDEFTNYCAGDVKATWELFAHLFNRLSTEFVRSDVSWVGMLEASKMFIPLDRDWMGFISRSETAYDETKSSLKELMQGVSDRALAEKPDYLEDLPWREMKVKDDVKVEWYRKYKQQDFTCGGKLAPRLLHLHWQGLPIRYKKEGRSGTWWTYDAASGRYIDKLPHHEKSNANLSTPLVAKYLRFVHMGLLTCPLPEVNLVELLEALENLSVWSMYRDRINSVHFQKSGDLNARVTIPAILPMGTQSRRTADRLWLVSSNPDPNKLGSEVNQMVAAPEGYSLVGADYTSEESWLATVLGDRSRQVIGSCEWSLSVLCGSKKNGTDFHSVTAKLAGVSRNAGKSINFAGAYGAGLNRVKEIILSNIESDSPLAKLNLAQREREVESLATDLLSKLKGIKTFQGFYGGIASDVFNALESGARKMDNRTIILEYKIPASLNSRFTGKDFHTTKQNWQIQSAGVDILHLTFTAMRAYINEWKLDARLCVSRHDEVRYLVKNEHIDYLALALQLTHLRVVAYVYAQIGLEGVPQSQAWFDSIDVDDRLRKEVYLKCETKSTPEGFPLKGYVWDVNSLKKKLKVS